MKLISFDIGIKNMAYCIFDISMNKMEIADWNVLNLLEKEMPSEKCSQMIPAKTKKQIPQCCTKTAKYEKCGGYFCETHAKSNKNFMIPLKKYSLTSLKKLKVDDLINVGKSHLIFLDIENISKLKKAEILDKVAIFFDKKSYAPIIKAKTKNAGETDLIIIGKQMKIQMNKIAGIDEITHVVIENQISPIANRMKTIQGMLAQYFIMKNSDIHIEFVSSSNKLKQFTGSPRPLENTLVVDASGTNPLPKTINLQPPRENLQMANSNYKENKKDGVFYCSRILESNATLNVWKDALNIKKKDDLADCFLQGIWYLKNKNILTYADDLKINIV